MLKSTELSGLGIGGSSEHLYWRVLFTKYCQDPVSSGYNLRISELYMYSVVGGADVTSGGTAFGGVVGTCIIGTGTDASDPSTGVAYAFDGTAYGNAWTASSYSLDIDTSTYTGTCPIYLGYQFVVPTKIVQFALAYPGGSIGSSQWPLQFSLQWSDDGTTWTTVQTFTDTTWTSANLTHTYTITV